MRPSSRLSLTSLSLSLSFLPFVPHICPLFSLTFLSHSSEEGAGAQGIHQDQAFPLPHPPFPTHSNIIYMYTPWSLENGGTYVIPGSATLDGSPVIVEGTDAEEYMANHPHGIVALCAPAGTCFVSDGRLLHAGAPRLAAGVRLGNNCYHCRAQMKQQENPYVSFTALDKASPKLMRMLFGAASSEVNHTQTICHQQSATRSDIGHTQSVTAWQLPACDNGRWC